MQLFCLNCKSLAKISPLCTKKNFFVNHRNIGAAVALWAAMAACRAAAATSGTPAVSKAATEAAAAHRVVTATVYTSVTALVKNLKLACKAYCGNKLA
jgi:uncharacterized protein YcsI (UPF0317 family)